MSVVAISPRPHRTGRPDRVAPPRPRTAPTLTITLDLGGNLTPGLARLVDLLGELADAGEGAFRHEEHRTRPADPSPPAPVDPAATTVEGADADPVRILAGTRVVRHGGRDIPLTRIEFDLLLFLAEHPRRVFTRLQLLANVWGYEHAVARTVDVHVRRLRAKLGVHARGDHRVRRGLPARRRGADRRGPGALSGRRSTIGSRRTRAGRRPGCAASPSVGPGRAPPPANVNRAGTPRIGPS